MCIESDLSSKEIGFESAVGAVRVVSLEPQSGDFREMLASLEDLEDYEEQSYKESCKVSRQNKERKNFQHKTAKKGKKKKEPVLKKVKLGPQFGMFNSLVIQNVAAMGFNANVKSAVENTMVAFAAMSECVSTTQFLTISMLYFKTLYTESVVETAGHFLAKFVGTTFRMTPQGGSVFGIPANQYPTWLTELKTLSNTWSLSLHAEGFHKLAKLASFCVGLGLCKMTDVTPTVAGFELFSLPPPPKSVTVISFVDVVFDLIVHFAEGGYMVFKTGSIKPLLYGSIDHQRYSDMYHACLKCSQLHACGNLGLEGLDDSDYDKLLNDTIELAERLLLSCRGGVEKSVFNRQLEKLMVWKTDFTETRLSGGLRIAPYTIGLFGGTAVGKSTMCPILMTYLLKLNGFNAEDERVVTLKEGDKYMSNYRSYVNGVILDDLGNTKPDFVTEAPTKQLIEIVNNARMYANMADVDRKGKVAVEPKVVLVTKNVKDGGASVYSREPASIARRDNVTLTIKVRPEYATNGMIDRDKLFSAFPDGTPLIPDLWLITAETAYPRPSGSGTSTVGWNTVTHNGKQLVDVSIFDVLAYLRDASQRHFLLQTRVVEDAKSMTTKLHVCKKCLLPCACCSCDPDDASTQSDDSSDPPTPPPSTDVPPPNPPTPPLQEVFGEVVGTPSDFSEGPDPDSFALLCDELDKQELSLIKEQKVGGRQCVPMAVKLQPHMGLASNLTAKAEKSYAHMMFLYFGAGPLALGAYSYDKIHTFASSRLKRYIPLSIGVIKDLELATTDVLLGRLKDLEQSHYMHWTFWIPEWAMKSPMGKQIVEQAHWASIRRGVNRRYVVATLMGLAGIVCTLLHWYIYGLWPSSIWNWILRVLALCMWSSPTVFMTHQAEALEREHVLEQICKRRNLATPLEKHIRDNHLTWILGTSVAFGALYYAVKAYRNISQLRQQGTLHPESMEEVITRDLAPNPWKAVRIEPTLPQAKSKTIAFEDLKRLVAHNTTHMQFEYKGKKYHCDAFFPKSNVVLIPRHMWLADTLKATFTRREESVGSTFTGFLSRAHAIDIPDMDLSLVWMPSGGDWRDLSIYFPITQVGPMPAHLCYREPSGEVWWSKTRVNPMVIDSGGLQFKGGVYELERSTFEGLCMAPLVSETIAPMLVGFHLAGRSGTATGGMGTLLVDVFNQAFEALKAKPGVVLCKSDDNLVTTQLSVQFFQGTELHPKSPVRHLDGQPNCRVYGTVLGKSTAYSVVKDSPISAAITEVCGVPQQWGPPPFRVGYKWQESLIYSSQPACGVPPEIAVKSFECYFNRVKWIISDDNAIGSDLRAQTVPLSNVQIVSGIDGRRFMDAMKGSTSAGYPLSGPKSVLFVDGKSDDHACPRDFPPWVWDEFAKVEACYINGVRYTLIFKACFKDEPTKIGKDKVRMFQAAPLIMQLGVRKYFLPVARLLSLYPTISECAVGVNAESPEWEVLDNFIVKHGENSILAGDYSKYDLRMPAQLMFAAFRVLLDLARMCGYSERDICVMEGFASEICYAYTNVNGDLVKLLGSNPSGQNLTVYINSIVNSMLMRSAFYSVYPTSNFNRFVNIMTYGDDVKGSVSWRCPGFNHLSVAKFLDAHDMKFTMPDKKSTPTRYMKNSECDFLKRVTFYNPELQCKIGILSDESIFKSLHSQMASKHVSAKEIAAQNIDGALMSWAYHGREKFMMRREQLRKVAAMCDIEHMCTRLNLEYDVFVEGWKKTFCSEGEI